jgi:uncharacterized protein (DUF433 family)
MKVSPPAETTASYRALEPFTTKRRGCVHFEPGVTRMLARTYRYIASVPGVRSGRPILEGTRVGVHDVVAVILTGSGIEDALKAYTDLTRAQVYECLSYYEDHKAEMDLHIAEQMAEA